MTKFDFNPSRYQKKLHLLIKSLQLGEPYEKVLRRYPKTPTQLFSKSEIISALRYFGLPVNLIAKPTRTLSGVVPVTLLTKPYPCPGRCIFCPNDPNMPKSYLSAEPGAQRASANNFDPYNQVTSRLITYHANGHSTDKIELIILGGTWSAYPLSYKIWFISRCFEALNDFVSAKTSRLPKPAPSGRAQWSRLEKAQNTNETAASRCVGLSLETRPDFITLGQLIEFRRLGCTKVQIGIQSLNNQILELNKRGHSIVATKKAVRLLRAFGFKIQAHWMANLYGSSPEKDISDFKKLFSQKFYRPDELKIYPTSLIATAELMTYYRKGLWRPYNQDELLTVLSNVLPQVPQYCRVNRVMRDFSSGDIVAGSKTSNLRQIMETNLIKQGKKIQEIRWREIRQRRIKPDQLKLKILSYRTSIGSERFLQFVTLNNQIAAFLRLSLPEASAPIAELKGSALIREIHVYGQALSLGETAKIQHAGLGSRLIQKAEAITREKGYAKLSVISAVGTREYYRQRGFSDGVLYQSCSIS